MSDILLDIKNLNIVYSTTDGVVRALNDANLQIRRGEALGLVGETGAGKTTLARGIMRLIPHRGRQISMIFQDPMTSLNPVMTVGDQILEVIRNHHPELSKQEAKKQAGDMLEMVGITAGRYDDYPHQFSGGMKQRVIIAIALACNPQLLIADEPTTALDVTIQAQVLEMIRDLKKKNNTSMLLITHDLGVVAQNCDSVAIIYAGEIVEYGTLCQVYENAMHPYTEGLFGSIPNLETNSRRLAAIDGMMPDPTALPEGCKFADRCKYATEHCRVSSPELAELEGGHKVRCFRYTT